MLKTPLASNKIYNAMSRMSGFKNRGYQGLNLYDNGEELWKEILTLKEDNITTEEEFEEPDWLEEFLSTSNEEYRLSGEDYAQSQYPV